MLLCEELCTDINFILITLRLLNSRRGQIGIVMS